MFESLLNESFNLEEELTFNYKYEYSQAIESKDEKYATLNDDLEGFWDMIVIQLNECEEAFNQLWVAQTNGWKSDSDQLIEVRT